MEAAKETMVGLAYNIVMGRVSVTALTDADYRSLGITSEQRSQMRSETIVKRADDILLKAILGGKLPDVAPEPEEVEKTDKTNRYADRVYVDHVAEANDKAQKKVEETPNRTESAVSQTFVDPEVANRWGIETGSDTIGSVEADKAANAPVTPGTVESKELNSVPKPDASKVMEKGAGTVESKKVVTKSK